MSKPLLRPGDIVRDTHTIVRHLGSGAFGQVYLSRHRYMGLQALKVFVLSQGCEALEEAYLLAKLSHPNIVRMFEANDFERGGAKYGYFTMEYVDGGTLLDSIADESLDLASRIDLGRGIVAGLAHAHSQDPPVIHRDISPSNVLLNREKGNMTAKISDFGLAKHVDNASLLASAAGKYVYMAPESFLGIHSTATDVYSTAIVLFELFTGKHPFEFTLTARATSRELAEVVKRSRSQTIPDASRSNPTLPNLWDAFFRESLVHDYEQRPKDGKALLAIFDGCAHPSQPSTTAATQGSDAKEMVKRAQALSKQTETIDSAIGLLESACEIDPSIRERYSDLLSLWKRGIVL
ncbi:MAG TPA: serine/threonine-protein kinase [Candidatus Sulfotelmatobacter sp.]|nr:serine/threonine-protein kinase [Candidatus Sulfotelmatobacter sp.]